MPYFSSVQSDSTQKSESYPHRNTAGHGILRSPLPGFSNDASTLTHAGGFLDGFDTSEKNTKDALDISSSPAPAPVATLPSPSESPRSSQAKKRKSTRFEHGLRVHWARFLRKVEGGEDDLSDSGEPVDVERSNSWERRRTEPDDAEDDAEDEKSVDEVVVDRSWGRSRTASESMSADEDGMEKSSGDAHHSRSLDNSGTSSSGDLNGPIHPSGGFWNICLPLILIRWRLWPAAVEFFSTKFPDKKSEDHYRKEIWFQSKPLALWSSLFFVINWVLGCALVSRPFSVPDTIFYFGVALVLTLPIPFLVMFDFARDRPYIYNTVLVLSTWSWSLYQIIYIFICGYYSDHDRYGLSCGNKDFLSLFYYTSALQTIALFGLKMHRLPAMTGALVFLVMSSTLVIPYRIGWIRNALNFIIFQSFLLYIHYMKEVGERRLFQLRDQLKMQFRATQKAQINERRASESKRRLTSYVRVPLNTALIAVQNMEASHMIAKDVEVEFNALTGSLSMMSKVLNDVLDFNRMDSGLLESVSTPYAFHDVMRLMFRPLQLATDARQLRFVTELDNSIDIIARRAVWESLVVQNKLVVQDGIDTFEKELEAHPDEDGIVVGDEMRLRQIVTNLVSNACKFTPTGGTLTVRTKLISPSVSYSFSERHGSRSNGESSVTAGSHSHSANVDLERGEYAGLSAKTLDQHNASHRKGATLDKIIVRIEVSDTGCGIMTKDITKGKLFSAFNQTEQGRLQGGKGTGLGLALVRHIVSLSGGRLGVQSKIGVGSTFWVELPLGVGKKAVGGTASSGPSSDRGGPSVVGRMRPSLRPVQSKSADALASASASSGSLGRSDTAVDSTHSLGQTTQSSSALKSIMEQGGLVELKPTRRGEEGHSIPTRSIGDPSTGTDTVDLSSGPPSPSDRDYDNLQDVAQQMEGLSTSVSRRPSHVDLPRWPSFGQTDGPNPTSNANGSSSRSVALEPPLRVLVVDDDQLTRKLMKRMLQRLGCIVSTAENGQIALELITDNGRTPASDIGDLPGQFAAPSFTPTGQRDYEGPRYEVIFLDNQMPVLSGLGLVSKLRELGRRDFVVGVTGNALISDQEEYKEAGADYVITKPVFEVNLKSMIALAGERRKNGEPSPRSIDC